MTENQHHALRAMDNTHNRVSFETGHAALSAGGPLDAPEYLETGRVEAFVDSFSRMHIETKRMHRMLWARR